MTRSVPVLGISILLFTGCAASNPPPPAVDPVTGATIVASIDEAVAEGTDDVAVGARIGRRVGVVVGVFAAVLGGPSYESVGDMVDRYRNTRDAVEITGALIGAAKSGAPGAKQGSDFDEEFAELLEIDGIEVTRPLPDRIDVAIPNQPSAEMLADIAAVLTRHVEGTIDIDAAGDAALDIRESLIDHGLIASHVNAHRFDRITGVAMRIRRS